MKRILFHGTDEKGYKGIIEKGFSPKETTWNVSDNRYTYFWDANFLIEKEECGCENEVIQRAFENAMISAAKNNQSGTSIYVVMVELDDEKVEICEDDSCENMYGAVCVSNDDLIEASITVYSSDYSSSLRLFYLSAVYDSQYMDIELSYIEEQAIKLLSSVYIDDLFLFEYKEISPV